MKRVAIVVLVCGLAAAGAFAGYKIHVAISFAADDSSTLFDGASRQRAGCGLC